MARLRTEARLGDNTDVSYCGDMGGLQVWRVSWFGELSQKVRDNVNMASIEVGYRDPASYVFIGKWACSSAAEQGTHNPLVPGSNPGGPSLRLERSESEGYHARL